MILRYAAAAFLPMLILLVLTLIACVVAYGFVEITGDQAALRKLIIRLSQLSLLLSIYPAMRYFNWRLADLGYAPRPVFLKQVVQGFALGLITLIPVFITLYALGINVVDEVRAWTVFLTAKRVVLSLLLALLIGVVEESVFRGMLLTGLKAKVPVLAAIVISSVYFAGLHFLDNKTPIPQQEFNFFSSLQLLAQAYANVFDAKNLGTFFALMMVGIFLAVIRTQVQHSLGLCIGCHAGWVWQMKMSGFIFDTNYASKYLYLVTSFNYVIGPLVTVWLFLAVVGYFMYKRYNDYRS
jgi:hypothetical protein